MHKPRRALGADLCTCSGDVGLGLNARRLRDRLLNQFSVTYSLRPIGDIGSVYRRYPGMWQVHEVKRVQPHSWSGWVCNLVHIRQ